jgi:hypothetical protein
MRYHLSLYEPAAACSLGTAQTPTAYLPDYSAGSPSHWWEEAVQEVCRTSEDPNTIENVLRLLPAPSNTIDLLSKRNVRWLKTCLQVICEAKSYQVPPYKSQKCTAQAIVDAITWRQSPPSWNGEWIISALMGSTEIPTIAEKFDFQIQSMFSRTTIQDWVAWRFGYPNNSTNFLDTVIQVRNGLIHYAQSHGTVKLTSLLKALPSQQPLPRWILSTAISFDASSHPSIPVRFIIDPIDQLFTEQQSNLPLLIQHLLIIETLFTLKIVNSTDVTWSTPFSVDFLLWKSINRETPQMLAESNTKSMEKLFLGISPRQIFQNDRRVKDIGKDWSDFSDDVLACLNADAWVTGYVIELAEVR